MLVFRCSSWPVSATFGPILDLEKMPFFPPMTPSIRIRSSSYCMSLWSMSLSDASLRRDLELVLLVELWVSSSRPGTGERLEFRLPPKFSGAWLKMFCILFSLDSLFWRQVRGAGLGEPLAASSSSAILYASDRLSGLRGLDNDVWAGDGRGIRVA